MRLTVTGEGNQLAVEVALSRRNLLALVQKLDMPGSARTLETLADVPAGCLLRVRAEEDAEHYQRRGWPPPGPLHPATEAFVDHDGQEPAR